MFPAFFWFIRNSRRVRACLWEPTWRPSQQLTPQKDGSLVAEFQLDGTREVKGIRVWGLGVQGLGVGVGGRFVSSKFYRSSSIARVCDHLIVNVCCIGTSDRSPGVHGEAPLRW